MTRLIAKTFTRKTELMTKLAIDFEDVKNAATRLSGHAVLTPVKTSAALDAIAGARVFAKCEPLQKTGSFKYRGAFNRLSQLSSDERARGVVAYSSGNHAQGVSRAAKELGISAVIVMPSDAPAVKVKGVLADGAKIISYDRAAESREQIADQISRDEGRIVVPSYDDAHIIAGQGTTGIELASQAPDLDAVIICMGGGGLCAGISTAFAALSPKTKIFGAEPVGYNDHQMSLASGQYETLVNPPPSLCDALMTPSPGRLTFPINRRRLSGVFAVTDEECLLTMALVKRHLGVQLEPGGAVAMASALSGRLNAYGNFDRVGVILSGGNVDPAIAARADALL